MKKKYKYFQQHDFMDCGPACLRMIAAFHGKDYTLDFLRTHSYITQNGVSLLGLCEAAEKIGFRTMISKISFQQFIRDAPLPCVLHWRQEHFVVLYAVKKKGIRKEREYLIGDPAHGLVKVDESTFLKCWISSDDKGVALFLDPTPDFYLKDDTTKSNKYGFRFLFEYAKPYKKYFLQILAGIILGNLIGLCFPFLTQSLVDNGVNTRNVSFIHLILLSQLILFLGTIAVDLIRNWLLLHVSTRISVSIISNFLLKIMKLPISFFESKNVGDLTQRITDHKRVETFLTGSTLNTLFSIVTLLVYSFVLSIYSVYLLLIFLAGSALSVLWICIFLNRRKSIDYNRFQRARETQNSLFEIITGMQEIKLYNSQRARRWNWERIQARLFTINMKSLALEQYQEIGSSFFTQLKNILISYSAAMLVIDQKISLGVMLSISYIIGQMNGPLVQLISFVRSIQDAKISLDRLGEIHNKSNEEINEDSLLQQRHAEKATQTEENETNGLIPKKATNGNLRELKREGIVISDLCFRYGAPGTPYVLDNINLFIPKGKITAIVGSSGSGKTTLMKLLLKFYTPDEGKILVDGTNLIDISANGWRSNCGTVMQDSFVFNDTIARNIAMDDRTISMDKLNEAAKLANLHEYIHKLPFRFTTRVSNTGSCLSGGQKQRLFIARAIYKDPKYLLFDEATSALDSNNEKIIMENLTRFYEGRTVIVIAHRLSTVKNADQIIVMKDGQIVEQGDHWSLAAMKGYYFELVKNQIELGAA
ncbi:peptidase domain-containing ABC transporter [Chitinophaga filiformis]|uniref:Peptidase domain-containing ABC transporter n=1 Tax=Chitinophaga filiformis TaxID=104663 RepID=A0ABY4I6G0_CHIFI|nr:peptidase domain-containing ABC transporter [Chitinophaga filiformis]UPK71673.1 peptidase domain-containing ABC transporter [Chitinophaga filiformis]